MVNSEYLLSIQTLREITFEVSYTGAWEKLVPLLLPPPLIDCL